MGDESSKCGDFEVPDTDNGFSLNGKYLPIEVLSLILSYVDTKHLLKDCLYVCKNWVPVIYDVWRIKALRMYPKLHDVIHSDIVSPKFYREICIKKPFNRNFIKNNSGQKGLKHWRIIDKGGNGWLPEKTAGVTSGEITFPTCFVTSYSWCIKEQVIDLRKEGLHVQVMDKLKPEIILSEWYANRWDCRATYKLLVTLLNHEKEPLTNFDFQAEIVEDAMWKEVKHSFKDYPDGVCYISFRHCGKDRQFWAGHYGAKMTNASVVLQL